tara:strand:+ start:1359 stop:1703 length:345 start_codon:yes stop_codon:yes gene_type:complete
MTKYFAKLSLNSTVVEVQCVADNIATTEQEGIDFLNETKKYPFWVETSKDGSIRKNVAVKGSTYNESKDAFISPKPFASWSLNENTCQWEAPSKCPIDDKHYSWDESITNWKEQ